MAPYVYIYYIIQYLCAMVLDHLSTTYYEEFSRKDFIELSLSGLGTLKQLVHLEMFRTKFSLFSV